MSLEDLRRACHLRGLNVQDQDKAVMLKYLTEWLTVTAKLDNTSMSLLLAEFIVLWCLFLRTLHKDAIENDVTSISLDVN